MTLRRQGKGKQLLKYRLRRGQMRANVILGMRHDTRTVPLEAMGFNLISLNTFYAGESYTEREHHAWLSAAGFVDITRAPFLLRDGFGSGLITARKRE